MTARAQLRLVDRSSSATPDFTRLTCPEARERVRQLICAGFAERTVAELVGWRIDDVRRACTPSRAPGLELAHG